MLFLLACGLPQQPPPTQELSPEESEKIFQEKMQKTDLDVGESVSIQNSNYIFYPISARLGNNSKLRSDFSYSKDGYAGYAWNLLFYHPQTQQNHLLLEAETGIIRDYPSEPSTYSENKSSPKPWLFYLIANKDYNENGFIDYKDPSYLFSSDLSGKNLQQISPPGLYVHAWKFIKNDTTLIEVSGQIDSNEDLTFDHRDHKEIWHIRLAPKLTQTKIISMELQDSLKQMFLMQFNP